MNQTESLTKIKEFDNSKVIPGEEVVKIKTENCGKWDDELTVKIHILRCVECGFESVDKIKFDCHLPCAASDVTITYKVYKCVICSTISTSKLIMEEHKKIYHAEEANVLLLEVQEHLKPQLINNDMNDSDKKVNFNNTFNSFPNKSFNSFSTNFNAIDFSKKVPKPPVTQFEFLNRTIPSENIDNSNKRNFENLLNSWQKSSYSTPNLQNCKRENSFPNLYNWAMISSMLQKQQQQNNLSPFSCTICKSSFLTNEELVRHVYFVHNLSGANDTSSLFGSIALNNQNFLKTPQVTPGLPSSFLSNPLWLNNMKIKSFNPIANMPQIQIPMACPFCKSIFMSFLQLDTHINQMHSNNGNIINPGSIKTEVKSDNNLDFYNEFRRVIMSNNENLNNQEVKISSQNNVTIPDGRKSDSNSINKVHNKNLNLFDENKKSLKTDNESPILEIKESRNMSLSPDNLFSNLKSTPQSQLIVHNTMRKTKSDLKVINRYFNQVKNEHRPVHEISPEELNLHLQDFVMNAKKKDGHEYEPESLKAFVHSLERFLKAFHNYPVSVLKDQQFHGTRAMLHQRLQELRLRSKSLNNQNGVNTITKFSLNHTSQSIQDLIKYEVIGHENPQALINTLWLINRVLFHIGGVHKHKNLLWGQFNLTQVFGQTCLQYYPNKVNFTNHNIKDADLEIFSNKERDTPISVGRGDSRLPIDAIEIFQIYANMRPVECRNVSDPFYLCPDPIWKKGGSWFKSINAGFQYISKIPRLMGFKSNTSIKSNSGLQPMSSMTLNKDLDMYDYDSSQIIDVDSQVHDDEHESHGSTPTFIDKNLSTVFTTQRDSLEQCEAMDMSSKLCHEG